ncbi:MAG: phosphoribosylanthranilate isomerase [Desulfobacca sp.]|uniref:phosphoribosylanthranilate isomerase n=1 Tax=Desulfobacca sp. TaxID=2067990 RepID=UPI00404AF552
MMRIKICGITSLEDALLAAHLGADALGFIFYPKSPRAVTPEVARQIIARLPPLVLSVGVFVNEDAALVLEVAEMVRLDWLQLHGEEPPDYCRYLNRNVLKAIRVRDRESLVQMQPYQGSVRAFLLDTYSSGQHGGTGQSFDWTLAREAQAYGPVVLAGGLRPDNVAAALRAAAPQAVDVASGVEAAPGRKDPEKLRAFFGAAQALEGHRWPGLGQIS